MKKIKLLDLNNKIIFEFEVDPRVGFSDFTFDGKIYELLDCSENTKFLEYFVEVPI